MPADLTTLDPAAVADNMAEAAARVSELHPTLDLKRGPVHDLVTYPHAVLAAAQQADLAAYLSARSLLDVEADPSLADDATVDRILSNYRVTRRAAGAASGRVVVEVSSDATVVLAAGAEFAGGGRVFATPRVFTAKAEPEQVVAAGDRLISPLPGGGYAFTVDVADTEAGAAGMLRKGAQLLPLSPPPGFVRAYAESDFDGGSDAETNAQLVARLAEGLAARGPSSRLNMAAMLRAFTDYRALSVVGAGDPEMLRDRHGLLPVPGGGRVDWYVRVTGPALVRTLRVSASYVGPDPSGLGVWQFGLGRDDFPGFYEVRAVRPAGADPESAAGSHAVVADERTVDLSGGGFAPDVVGAVEGAYSRYQAAVVRFLAPAPGRSPGDAADFDADVVGQPALAEVQAYVASRDNRSFGADCLVRAPVPCFVRVGLTVNTRPGDAGPDADAARAAVAAAVNSAGFTGRLFASDLLAAALPHLGGGGVTAVDLFGRVRRPDGTSLFLHSREALAVPDEPSRCVSPRTVQFYCDPADVAVATVASVPPP